MIDDKRCGNCRRWSRGGVGAGRGGGYCLEWMIPKVPGNRITNEKHGCWLPFFNSNTDITFINSDP